MPVLDGGVVVTGIVEGGSIQCSIMTGVIKCGIIIAGVFIHDVVEGTNIKVNSIVDGRIECGIVVATCNVDCSVVKAVSIILRHVAAVCIVVVASFAIEVQALEVPSSWALSSVARALNAVLSQLAASLVLDAAFL